MMQMKSDRPLLVNGEPRTEFETDDHHGKELIAKGFAVEVGEKAAAKHEDKSAPAPANKVATAVKTR